MDRQNAVPAGAERLAEAVRAGDRERVVALLADGADPDGRDGNRTAAIEHAVRAGHADVVAELLRAGADPNQQIGDYRELKPLNLALGWGYLEVARLLLVAGASTGIQSERTQELPLVVAVICPGADHRESLIDLLLEYGADLEDRSMKGMTPLEWTAGTPSLGAVRHLLTRGATPTPAAVRRARDAARWRPQHAATYAAIEQAVLRAEFLRRKRAAEQRTG
ncbi:ankyrin repeat domain-containing protein [Kitasatospora cheerisanensis]|uniref:Uncharacterized protein n=1 Tax=Kitasatospora cheerisanensis KCTC 2395 TaxID=1348663 RepID=A0A066YRN0_9ACTN|nr:ankyrin repeat domain-containing protein [Kitasatospora cheerisanensis]KDN80726.1 hypothetical protein KCH_75060 [Kitasatospora cheerisanensis KCTC 2395]